jgi:hypothetical protein
LAPTLEDRIVALEALALAHSEYRARLGSIEASILLLTVPEELVPEVAAPFGRARWSDRPNLRVVAS